MREYTPKRIRTNRELVDAMRPIPASFKASTLRLIADHLDAPQGKKIIINPDSKMREEWAILLNGLADGFDAETPA